MNDDSNIENLDQDIDLRQYWHIVWRRRWVFCTVFIIIVISVIVYSFYKTPIYQATTTLIIEPDIPQILNMNNVSSVNTPKDFYATQYEIIRSYAVVKKTFDILDLWNDPKFMDTKDPVQAFRKSINVDPIRNTRLVKVNIDNTNPTAATHQVNTLARVYIQHNLEDRRASSKDAFTWLSEQIAILKAKVLKSEMDLLKFKEEEDIVSLEKRQALLEEKISTMHDSYIKTSIRNVELKTMLKEVRELTKHNEMAESLPKIYENTLIQSLKAEYSKLDLKMAQISVKYKPKHPQIVSLQSQISKIKKRLSDEVNKIAKSIEIDYQINRANEEAIEKNLDDLKHQSMLLAQKAIQYGVLKREAESNRQMFEVLLHRLKETDITGNITANNIRVVDEAKVPNSPIKPNKRLNAFLAIIIGLFSGIGLCFFLEYIDDTLKGEEDVKFYLNTAVLGHVPKEKKKIAIIEAEEFDVLTRSYRDIKTTISFYRSEHMLKTLLVTSAIKGEGKTTSVLSLGKAFAKEGHRVLLIDADLYKPEIGKRLQINHNTGLSDICLSDQKQDGIIHKTQISNLYAIPGGLIPPNPAEVIGSNKLKNLINEVKKDFDIVLLDTPPFSIGMEVSVLGSFVDGIVLVIKANSTSRIIVSNVIEKLKIGNSNIIGIILIGVDSGNGFMDKYYEYSYKTYSKKNK